MLDFDQIAKRLDWRGDVTGQAILRDLQGPRRYEMMALLMNSRDSVVFRAGFSAQEIADHYHSVRHRVDPRLRPMWDRVVSAWSRARR